MFVCREVCRGTRGSSTAAAAIAERASSAAPSSADSVRVSSPNRAPSVPRLDPPAALESRSVAGLRTIRGESSRVESRAAPLISSVLVPPLSLRVFVPSPTATISCPLGLCTHTRTRLSQLCLLHPHTQRWPLLPTTLERRSHWQQQMHQRLQIRSTGTQHSRRRSWTRGGADSLILSVPVPICCACFVCQLAALHARWASEQQAMRARLETHDRLGFACALAGSSHNSDSSSHSASVDNDSKADSEASASMQSSAAYSAGSSACAPPLTLVGGVDISFVENSDAACAALVVCAYPPAADGSMRVVHELMQMVTLTEPYVPGFLAFREVPHLLRLIDEVRAKTPQFTPQLIMVDGQSARDGQRQRQRESRRTAPIDAVRCVMWLRSLCTGNGMLHPRGSHTSRAGNACQCSRAPSFPRQRSLRRGVCAVRRFGLACQLGVLADVPTLGIGKNLHMIDGLERDAVDAEAARCLQRGGQSFPLVGDSGTTWGACVRSTDSARNPIFVSIGHRISLDTAVRLAHACCQHRIPEPVRLADLRSREFIRQWTKKQGAAAAGAAAASAAPVAAPAPAPALAASASSSSASPLSSSRSPAERKHDAESDCPPPEAEADSAQQMQRQASRTQEQQQRAGAQENASSPSGAPRPRQTFVPAERAAACVLT